MSNVRILEIYYRLFLVGKLYREEDVYKVAMGVEMEPDMIWVKLKFLGLAIAYNRDYEEDEKRFTEQLRPLLSNPHMVEHIRLCLEQFFIE